MNCVLNEAFQQIDSRIAKRKSPSLSKSSILAELPLNDVKMALGDGFASRIPTFHPPKSVSKIGKWNFSALCFSIEINDKQG